MRACPFCLEQIQDQAIKCRYCGSFGRSSRDRELVGESPVRDHVLFKLDRESVRFAKYVVWCLAGLIALAAVLYVHGVHVGSISAKPEQITYTFLMDGELFRFVKVAGAVLGV